MNTEYIQKAKEEYEFIIFDYFKEEIKFKNKYIDEKCEYDDENDIRNYYSDLYYEAKDEVIRSIVSRLCDYFIDKTSPENEALWLVVKHMLDSQGFDFYGYRDITKEYDEEMFYKILECFCEVLVVVDPKGFQEIVDGKY